MKNKVFLSKLDNKIEIERIIKKFNNLYFSPLEECKLKELANKFYNNADVYVARIENNDIGYIAFYANDTAKKITYISQIAVSEKFQGYGVGKKLIEKCIEKSLEKGMNIIQLEVYKQNEKAIQFYKKNGFEFMCFDGIKMGYFKNIRK